MLRLQLELHKPRTSTLQSFANKRRFVQQFASLQVKMIIWHLSSGNSELCCEVNLCKISILIE